MKVDAEETTLENVAQLCYIPSMSGTTTVRLDDEDEAILELLAAEYGGRSSVIRQALRSLAAERQRQDALRSFLDEWAVDGQPISDKEVASMVERFNL